MEEQNKEITEDGQAQESLQAAKAENAELDADAGESETGQDTDQKWVNPKERLYDKLPITLKQVDCFIIIMIVLLVILLVTAIIR